MTAKNKQIIIRTIFFALCIAILVSAPVLVAAGYSSPEKEEKNFSVLTIWQIDSFEGGKGSRTSYLQNIGNRFAESGGCYVNVVSVGSAAALKNIDGGTIPDMISYGAGMCGIESIINGKTPYVTWAYGAYCMLAVDDNADFGDVSKENTVVDSGTENLSGAAALLCNLNGADFEKPTSAYVSLINGKYKYLLGTQRDIYRLKTRGVSFKIKPITEFNDLYQNISVTASQPEKIYYCEKYIEYLKSCGAELSKLGLMGEGKLYTDEMSEMENTEYEYRLISPVSQSAKDEILAAIEKSDIKMLKNLLK